MTPLLSLSQIVPAEEAMALAQGKAQAPEAPTGDWRRFTVTLNHKKLGMYLHTMEGRNVHMGQWLVVCGFKKKEGRSIHEEATGLVKPNDVVVGCGDVDLHLLSFEEAMETLLKAETPKTLHFIRNLEAPTGELTAPSFHGSWRSLTVLEQVEVTSSSTSTLEYNPDEETKGESSELAIVPAPPAGSPNPLRALGAFFREQSLSQRSMFTPVGRASTGAVDEAEFSPAPNRATVA